MSKSRVFINQSNYIPWKGFFNNIADTDYYVVFDEVQYTRRDWRNRNKIKTQSGTRWLTIPVKVKGRYEQKISETYISDALWNEKHLEILKHYYKNAPAFDEVISWIESLYHHAKFKRLTEINVYFIKKICEFLEIKTTFVESHELELREGKTERLIGICEQLNAQAYWSGPSAKGYIEEEKFEAGGLDLHYFDYENYPEYHQLYLPFEHHVSVLDLIFNEGSKSKEFLKRRNVIST